MFDFEWDPAKAASNLRKHGVAFKLAATVFRDTLIRSIPDEEHSDAEERWVTVGEARTVNCSPCATRSVRLPIKS